MGHRAASRPSDQVNRSLAGLIFRQDVQNYPFPDFVGPGCCCGMREQVWQVREIADYAVILNITLGIIHAS